MGTFSSLVLDLALDLETGQGHMGHTQDFGPQSQSMLPFNRDAWNLASERPHSRLTGKHRPPTSLSFVTVKHKVGARPESLPLRGQLR